MSHQPFETMIYQDAPRTTQQEAELQLHLRDCPQCARNEKAWLEVRSQLAAAPLVQPVPGFTKRWEQKLAMERVRQRERQVWYTILIIVGSLLLLLVDINLAPRPVCWPGPLLLLSLFPTGWLRLSRPSINCWPAPLCGCGGDWGPWRWSGFQLSA